MHKINLRDIPLGERTSPQGKFAARFQQISVALGRDNDSFDLAKRHPFDLARLSIPPGKAMCPYHEHSAQWELYWVVSGVGTIRDSNGETEVTVGDAFYFAPGQAHQLTNRGPEDFTYYVIADNPVGDTCYYPDSGKWTAYRNGQKIIIRGTLAEYLDGEE